MMFFLLGLRGYMNTMVQAYKNPNDPGEDHWFYNLHKVHIEGEDVRTYNNENIPLYKVRVGTDVSYTPKSAVVIRREPAKALEDVSLRSGPSMNSPIVDLIFKGQEIYVYDHNGDFLDIEYNGKRGFIKENACDYKDEVYPGNNDGERAVAIVKSKIGCKYVLACESTGPYIFDCSGLMLWAFNRLDIHLNRTASRQIYGLERLPKDDMSKWLPGDVITFHTDHSNPDSITHVGMYIGNGQFIHASTNGYVVRYQDYVEYNKTYSTAYVTRYFKV